MPSALITLKEWLDSLLGAQRGCYGAGPVRDAWCMKAAATAAKANASKTKFMSRAVIQRGVEHGG